MRKQFLYFIVGLGALCFQCGNKVSSVTDKVDLNSNEANQTNLLPSIELILLNDFSDSLRIFKDEALIYEGYFLTNESTASCGKSIPVRFDSAANKTIIIRNMKDSILYTFDLNCDKKYLYVWRKNGVWTNESSDKIKQLE